MNSFLSDSIFYPKFIWLRVKEYDVNKCEEIDIVTVDKDNVSSDFIISQE